MRAHRIVPLVAASLIAGGVTFAQVGRGWSDWPTPYADAQRTSWLQTDPNISVESLSKPGFELQWTSKLDNQRRGPHGLTQGVTAQRRHALRAGVDSSPAARTSCTCSTTTPATSSGRARSRVRCRRRRAPAAEA